MHRARPLQSELSSSSSGSFPRTFIRECSDVISPIRQPSGVLWCSFVMSPQILACYRRSTRLDASYMRAIVSMSGCGPSHQGEQGDTHEAETSLCRRSDRRHGVAVPAGAITDGRPEDGATLGPARRLRAGRRRFTVRRSRCWFELSGTLLSPTVVLTAGHCTYGVGLDGVSTTEGGGDGTGGNDVWLSYQRSARLRRNQPERRLRP